MRLTVNLEPDIYAVARSLAKAEDCTISAALNRLLRFALRPKPAVGKPVRRNGLLVSDGAFPVTPEMVKEMEEDYP